MKNKICVIKLGGSLFDDCQVVQALRRWLDVKTPAIKLVIVGGGGLVEQIRHWDTTHHLTERQSHRLALAAMSVTANLLHDLYPEATLISRLTEIERCEPRPIVIFDIWPHWDLLPCLANLPESWQVTSDSIAATIANELQAELTLLKSCLPEPPYTVENTTAQGYTDSYFPVAARGVEKVQCVDLLAKDSGKPIILVHGADP